MLCRLLASQQAVAALEAEFVQLVQERGQEDKQTRSCCERLVSAYNTLAIVMVRLICVSQFAPVRTRENAHVVCERAYARKVYSDQSSGNFLRGSSLCSLVCKGV